MTHLLNWLEGPAVWGPHAPGPSSHSECKGLQGPHSLWRNLVNGAGEPVLGGAGELCRSTKL